MSTGGKKTKQLGIGGTVLVLAVVVVIKLLGGGDLLDQGNEGSRDGTAAQRSGSTSPRASDPAPSNPPKQGTKAQKSEPSPWSTARVKSEDDLIERLFRNQQSDEILTLAGMVVKTLPDDNEGSRHQRFIVKLSSGRTVLIAHNIDLAPRVPLRQGDRVTIHGEYEWSERGGTVHWTHHDPKKWREGGWIDHKGKRYE